MTQRRVGCVPIGNHPFAFGRGQRLVLARVERAVEQLLDLLFGHVLSSDPNTGDEYLLVQAAPPLTHKD